MQESSWVSCNVAEEFGFKFLLYWVGLKNKGSSQESSCDSSSVAEEFGFKFILYCVGLEYFNDNLDVNFDISIVLL